MSWISENEFEKCTLCGGGHPGWPTMYLICTCNTFIHHRFGDIVEYEAYYSDSGIFGAAFA